MTSHILPPFWRDTIRAYVRDDCPGFDIQGYVVGDAPEEATLLAKTPCVLAGTPFFTAVFEELGCTVEWLLAEGTRITAAAKVAIVRGPVRCILLGERTALNIISRASGIAFACRGLRDLADSAGWHGEIAGTRKVTPGFRMVEKYSLLVGGVSTHRMDLSQMVMLKDNHIWAAGNISAAVAAARSMAGFSMKIEVEARNLEEAKEAAAAGADVVMLDNYTPAALAIDAAALKVLFPHVLVEASGGITSSTITQYFSPHVDVLSMGSLTHGYGVADFSLKIAKGAGISAIERVTKGREES